MLGETVGLQVFSGLADLQEISCHMAGQCRRYLKIYSQRLNRKIYDQPCFIEAVKALALRHANSRVDILVADTEQIRLGGHRLLDLSRKLPSSIQIRLRSEFFAYDLRSFIIADDVGFILRPVWYDMDDITASFRDRYTVRGLTEAFIEAWEQSEPDPQLRQFII